ncbi:hypothetical protein ACFOY7_12340 [Gracilibacillus xinjiangensis]|uniref:Lipoprotein n=1 Tax=Gracilibacillus xinjiangensis TaxID=1193282 RepID=A0ABV8WVH2_9BACI
MKKVSIIFLASILIMLGACSDTTDESNETTDNSSTTNKQEDTSDSSSEDTENNGISPEPNEEPDSSAAEIDIEKYLNENYRIENTHYVTKKWENEETERADYTVNILPDTKEFGHEINEVFSDGTPYEDDRTKIMFDMAEQIMNELPEINNKVHIDSVNWVSNIDDFSVMLIQDYENSNPTAGDQEDNNPLSEYSSQQIEYARVWLQLGPNQEIDELNVRHIAAGEPMNPNDDKSAAYPEDVIQLAGSRLVDGSVTYSGNGDGTINVYNVPLRWDGDYTKVDESFYTDIIENTELVYVDPGDEEEIIELIKLLKVH